MLFLLHLISKMRLVAKDGTSGSRIGIVLNGSPLFTGMPALESPEIRAGFWNDLRRHHCATD